MRLSALLAAPLALALLAGCTPSAAPAPDPAAQPAPGSAGAGDHAAALRTWAANRPAAYAYDLEISCFCIHRGEYAVEVRGGEITAVRDAAGAPVTDARLEWIVTVDRLFEVIGQAAQAGTPVRAAYHPAMGYPTEAEVGLLANDSGTLYRIGNLRAT